MALPRERTAPDSTIKPPIHEFSARYPRTSPHLPANPRISRRRVRRGTWQNPPAPGCGGGGIWPSRLIFACASARICAHFPSKFIVNLSKNPVNLSNFTDIFGYYFCIIQVLRMADRLPCFSDQHSLRHLETGGRRTAFRSRPTASKTRHRKCGTLPAHAREWTGRERPVHPDGRKGGNCGR